MMVPDRENWDLMKNWCLQRQAIADRRAAGENDWYKDIDPDISRFHYCNLRRMDDRVSRWMEDNWFKPARQSKLYSPQKRLFVCAVARQINLPDTLEAIGFPIPWDADHVERVMANRREAGTTNYTGAYITTGTIRVDGERTPKHVQTTQVILERFYQKYVDRPREIPDTMEELHADLCQNIGFASFMAGQVVADARWAGVWDTPPADRHRWAPRGPGSLRGLGWLYADDPNSLNAKQFLPAFHTFLDQWWGDPDLENLGSRLGLEAHDLQNVLCETSKYIKLKKLGKTPKRRYKIK